MSEHVANHVINPTTGFLENPAFSYSFDSDKKISFIQLIRDGFKEREAASQMGVHFDTVKKHLNLDPQFKIAVEDALAIYGSKLESVSRINALNPKSVIERIFQLKALYPEKYGDAKSSGAQQITINIDAKALENVVKREKILDAELITSTLDSATESKQLSDSNHAGDNPAEVSS